MTERYDIVPCSETQPLTQQFSEIIDRFDQATTYFDYLDLIPDLEQCRETFDELSGYHEVATLEGHTNWIHCVAFSPDGKILASASKDRTIRLWDMETGGQIAQIGEHVEDVTAIAFSPGGRLLAVGDHYAIQLWDIETKQQIVRLEGHTDWIYSINFSLNGERLASASEDGTIRIWEVESQQQLVQFGEHLGDALRYIEGNHAFSAVFSPNGRFLASGFRNKVIRLYDFLLCDVDADEKIALLEGHTSWVYSTVFSPDGKLLASGSRDKTIRIWDVETKEQIAIFEESTNWVNAVCFSPNGKLLG